MKKLIAAIAVVPMIALGTSSAIAHDTRQSEIAMAVKAAIDEIIPSGAVIAYLGPNTSAPEGWEICGLGGGAFPSLEGRFLVGTHHMDSVGQETGASTHDHDVSIRSTDERDGHRDRHPEGADNWTGSPNWSHKHQVSGQTAASTHIPPAIQVLFFCKQ